MPAEPGRAHATPSPRAQSSPPASKAMSSQAPRVWEPAPGMSTAGTRSWRTAVIMVQPSCDLTPLGDPQQCGPRFPTQREQGGFLGTASCGGAGAGHRPPLQWVPPQWGLEYLGGSGSSSSHESPVHAGHRPVGVL